MLKSLLDKTKEAMISVLPVVFLVLIIVLLVKPAGLLGKRVQEKV